MIKFETFMDIVNNPDSFNGKVFAITIQLLIIATLVTFTIDTLPGLPKGVDHLLNVIEGFSIAIFTIEYILRIIAAKKKTSFIFSFYGLADLLAILPFYISSGLDLRAVRVFRLLRLIRILKLFRYNHAIKRFRRAVFIAKEEPCA